MGSAYLLVMSRNLTLGCGMMQGIEVHRLYKIGDKDR